MSTETHSADAADAAADATDRAKQSLNDLKENVSRHAREHADAAKERLHGHAEDRRQRVAENLRGVASGLQTAAGEIREKPETTQWQADGIARVSEVAEKAADYLAERDTKELLTDARAYAQEHPLATIGGALLLGVVAARLFKASEEHRHGSGGTPGGVGGRSGGTPRTPSGDTPDPVALHGTMSPAAPGASTPAAVPPPPSRAFEPSAPPPTGV